MGSHNSRKKRKRRDNSSFEDKYMNLSKEDKEEIDLLNIQEKAVGLLLYSDLCFYLNVNQNIEILLDRNNNENKTFQIGKVIESLYSFFQFTDVGLLGMALIFIVDTIRYRNLNREYSKGKIKHSLLPELYICTGGFFQVLCYKYFTVSAREFYRRALNDFYYIYESDKYLLLNICILMLKASIIRISGDSYFYQSTILYRKRIYDKYEKKVKNTHTENPDLLLLQGNVLYFSSRVIITKANIGILNEVYKDTDSDEKEIYLLPNKIVVMGNIIGIIANMFSIYGVSDAYERNKNEIILGI